REPLGNQPAVILRPAQDFRAVTLDDERDLQPVILPSTSPSLASIAAGEKSCSRRRWPAITPSRTDRSYTSRPSISAANSRSLGAKSTPAPPSVSGTAPAA